MIKVIVGPGPTTFVVHENVIRAKSRFFEAALSKDWLESRTREVHLLEESPDIFHTYLQVLYSGAVRFMYADTHTDYNILEDLVAVADRLQDDKLKDEVANAIIIRTYHNWPRTLPTGCAISNIYSVARAGDPIRKLLVDVMVCYGHGKDLNRQEDYHHDFLYDLGRALLSQSTVEPWSKRAMEDVFSAKPCTYHCHEEGAACGLQTSRS